MNDHYVTIQQAARLLGITDRRVRQMCSSGKLPGAKRVGRSWQIPITADAKLRGLGHVTDKRSGRVIEQLAAVPAHKRDEALRRVGVIKQFEKFASEFVGGGRTRLEAQKIFAKQQGIGERTLRRWISKYQQQKELGLVDSRGGYSMEETISQDAWEMFKSMYLTPQQLSVKLCWTTLNYLNESQEHNWQIPVLRTMQRMAAEQIPLAARVLLREGQAAYDAKCAPYIQVDPHSVQPGEVWIGDHHQCDCWVRHRGEWIRPWLTAWEDMRSRTLVGWHVCASPNQTTIMIAFRRGIEQFGPPGFVKIDNGKDYDSEMWTGTTKQRRQNKLKGVHVDESLVAGLYSMLDIGVSFSIPYHPQSKAVERFFDTLEGQFVKTIKTYCGKDTNRRPENLFDYMKTQKALNESLSLEQFAAQLEDYLEVYNQTPHSGKGMDGRSPIEVMSQRESRRVVCDDVLDLIMRVWSGELKVGKNGVRFKNLLYGQFDPKLMAMQGQKVRVAYNPDDISSVWVYDATTMQLVTIARQNQLVNYGDAVSEDALREGSRAKARARKAMKQIADHRLTANMDLPTVAVKAQRAAVAKQTEDKPQPTEPQRAAALQPVRTPLDGQVTKHVELQLKKAVGAESQPKSDLGLNLDALRKPESKRLKLFDE